uniref:CSON000132 protein n=1 Tax=Culicoides sonorensis TaxID=179676 RepID=A0A336LPB3_CULSO
MGSDKKKHKKESKKHKRRSDSDEDEAYRRERSERKKAKKQKEKKKHRRSRSRSLEEVNSESSDCIEVPLSAPPPPSYSQEPRKNISPEFDHVRERRSSPIASLPTRKQRTPTPPKISNKRKKSMSPIPDGGAGDCLSIEETNKLRAKLGLKPLEINPVEQKVNVSKDTKKDSGDKKETDLKVIKDDWGEFVHKPAENFAEKNNVAKIREKLKERREKRVLEAKISSLKTLGESDGEDDAKNWVLKQRDQVKLKEEAAKRAKMLEEMDEEFGVGQLIDGEIRKSHKKTYTNRDLRGLKVEHDISSFTEGKDIILTLKDKDVLNEDEDDTLVNVNFMDDERYKKSVENKKQNPNRYGYDVYEEEVDEFGQPIQRSLLKKYDEEIEGLKKSSFVIGENAEEERKRKRKLQELKAKLDKKSLVSLDKIPLTLASEYYNEEELTKFKKPKKKVKKLRQKLKADDLLAISGDHNPSKDLGSRRNRLYQSDDISDESLSTDLSNVKVEIDDDLEQVLSKARRLKQKEAIIQKPLPIDVLKIKEELKEEEDDKTAGICFGSSNMILNETAEFCRTLGDIPTYGLAGNRDTDTSELMDFDQIEEDIDENIKRHNTWNTIDPNEENHDSMDISETVNQIQEAAILDEEPDVARGVGAALKLAMSKGYLEKEENNRPSNAKFAHLQAQHYSIDDKAYGEDDKYSRRDRYSGPISEFKEKEGFKPNVKLEYIDDNGHILNAKEAFRYLSHKFHGKGPGKNKVEKRLKKAEQEGLMMKMSSTDTPLGTLSMLQQKQKETHSAYVVLSGNKAGASTSFMKEK